MNRRHFLKSVGVGAGLVAFFAPWTRLVERCRKFLGLPVKEYLDAGYVYLPYIPIYTTPEIVLAEFKERFGNKTYYQAKDGTLKELLPLADPDMAYFRTKLFKALKIRTYTCRRSRGSQVEQRCVVEV